MAYQFSLLWRHSSPEAERHNDEWLGPDTLGIEVTSESLAARCGLGNNDPQHQIGGKSSAIEEALTWPLPRDGSKLVTIRPDKDSIGAMAIFALRAQGKENKIDKMLVSWVGAIDRYGYKNALEMHPYLASCFGNSLATDVLNAICLNYEPWPELADKVYHVGRILCGEMEDEELERLKKEARRPNHREFPTEVHGELAFLKVCGELDQARNWANHRFPIAVIYDDRHFSEGRLIRKWSLVKQPQSSFDRFAFEEAINRAEAKARGITVEELRSKDLTWGGTPYIISSRESSLSESDVLEIVERYLQAGVSS